MINIERQQLIVIWTDLHFFHGLNLPAIKLIFWSYDDYQFNRSSSHSKPYTFNLSFALLYIVQL